jgi:LmbE family N-acetylglucosaminyl deacetylase
MPRHESEIYPYHVTDLSSFDALVIAPHPDDEAIGCGGVIARHVNGGSRVKVLFLTDGGMGDFEGRYGDEYRTIRQQSAREALDILGVADYEFWNYGDRSLYQKMAEMQVRLDKTINAFSPSIIYGPSGFELHPDHLAAFEILWEKKERNRLPLALYESLVPLIPTCLVDITDVVELKRRAIACYHTELYYNDYVGKIIGLNRARTATLPPEVGYAEAFMVWRPDSSARGMPFRLLETWTGRSKGRFRRLFHPV